MKTPSGTRSTPISRGDDDGGDAAGDDGRDDPKLRAMRQVWLEMRSQDPPAGGMIELLAAARAKASTLQPRATWWQRLVAALRRPPVLAFATVVVLIGGAVVFTRRMERGSPEAMIEAARGADPPAPHERARGLGIPSGAGSEQTETAAEPQSATVVTIGDPSTTTARGADRSAEGRANAGPETPGPPGPRVAAPVASASRGAQEPSAAVVSGSDGDTRGDAAGRLASGDSSTPEVVPTRAAKVATPDDRERSVAQELAAPEPASPAPPVPAADDEPSSEQAVGERRDQTRAPRGPSGSTLRSLYRQCEAAAERGDCAAVRRLAAQIATRDREYRARISRDSAVAKCLAN